MLILATVSLAATIVIVAGGGTRTSAQLAARAALRHPLSVVEQVQRTATTRESARASHGAAADASASVSHPSRGASSADGGATAASPGASDSSSSGLGSGSTAAGSGSRSVSGTSAAGSGSATTGSASGSGAATPSPAGTTTPSPTDAGLPRVRHVFILTLSTARYRDAFAPSSAAPYLRRLATRGTVLSGFHTLGHGALADLLAMVSGQPPNADSAAGCSRYVAFPLNATLDAAGIAKGKGCVYPDAALTVADQVNAAGQTWGAYVADMGQSNCPVPATGEALDTPLAGTQAGYDVAHNPFAFFGSLLDAGGCSEYDQDLTHLSAALAKPARTPNLTYIGGDACVDADPRLAPTTAPTGTTPTNATTSVTDTSTAATSAAATGTATSAATTTAATTSAATTTAASDAAAGATGTGTATDGTAAVTTTQPVDTSTVPARLQVPSANGCPGGEPSGVAAENAFLKTWVPRILRSAAYRANGVLIIAFTGTRSRADTGALVLSRWTPRHRRIRAGYDAYSLLHSVEDMLDLQPLARAAKAPGFAQLVLR